MLIMWMITMAVCAILCANSLYRIEKAIRIMFQDILQKVKVEVEIERVRGTK